MFVNRVLVFGESCQPTTSLTEAVNLFCNNIYTLPIVEKDGEIKGIMAAQTLAKALSSGASASSTVEMHMEKAIKVDYQTTIADLIKYPLEKIVVVDEKDKLLGTISLRKLIATLLVQRDNASGNLNAILTASSNAIISIDEYGNINYLNKSAASILQVTEEEALGTQIFNFVPNSRLMNVVNTGESEIAHRFVLNNNVYITNRTPVIQKEKITGAVAVFQDITEVQSTVEELMKVRQYKEILETIIDNDYDCIVVVDNKGIITMFNKAYENFINVPRHKAIGRHVTDVIENTRMHIVLETGVAEMAELQKICGHEMICNRIPIKKDGKIWGALGKVMFKDVKEFNALVDKYKKLEIELEYYKDMVKKIESDNFSFDNIIGSGPQLLKLKEMAKRVALSNSTILIRGESGTGKDLFAHAIHYTSPRKKHPFIKLNCAAIPDNLLESELFGYDEGAFTGAKKGGKLGKFELADKGTLFLDEVGDMPLNMQVKLLRAIQEKEIERVGGTRPISVDVRIVAATNRNLEELVKDCKFRIDLYYRLNVVEIRIPPLRSHKNDIQELVHFLLYKLAEKMGCPVPTIDGEAWEYMLKYDWPGNVRELENVLERCMNFMDRGTITAKNLPFNITNYQVGSNRKIMELKNYIEEAERIAIINALKICEGNRHKAAKMLGISRANIYQKINKYNIF